MDEQAAQASQAIEFGGGYFWGEDSSGTEETTLWGIPILAQARVGIPITFLEPYAGVGAGAFVAVARADAADMAVAWLAVLKAGGAYLPIDPDLPAGRLGQMLETANVAHAIADEAMAARLARPGIDVVCPERETERIAAHAASAPPGAARPTSPHRP
mgnify:CR=1 FL=1